MKQQCHVGFVYGSWLILLAGFVVLLVQGNILESILWVLFIVLFVWLYVRHFPAVSSFLGYGSVADRSPGAFPASTAKVTLYTGLGCPFCPLVKRRLHDLQPKMGFALSEVDVTLKPNLLIAKGIRALPVVRIGDARWVGNATTEQLAAFISGRATTK